MVAKKAASDMKFSELLEELERRIGTDLSQSDMDLVVQMKGFATVDKIEEVLSSTGEERSGRTRRFEGVGTSTLVDITDVPVEDDDASEDELQGTQDRG